MHTNKQVGFQQGKCFLCPQNCFNRTILMAAWPRGIASNCKEWGLYVLKLKLFNIDCSARVVSRTSVESAVDVDLPTFLLNFGDPAHDDVADLA
jgi:hypothetical protein